MCFHLTSSDQYFCAHLDMEKKSCTRQHKRHSCTYLQSYNFLFYKLNVYLFDILLGRVYKEIPEATNNYIYCTSVKDYLLKLLSEPAYRLTRPIEILQKWKTSICLILQGNTLSKKDLFVMNITNIKNQIQPHLQKVCNFNFAIFLDSNQLISKLNVYPKVFCLQL